MYAFRMSKLDGSLLLKKWLEDTGRKANWAASAVPINRSHFHQWLNGTYTPRAVYRIRIAEITGGAVPAESWGNAANQIDDGDAA